MIPRFVNLRKVLNSLMTNCAFLISQLLLLRTHVWPSTFSRPPVACVAGVWKGRHREQEGDSGHAKRAKGARSRAQMSFPFPFERRLRVVPHFSSGIVERAKREHAWKSPHARKGDIMHFSLSPPRVSFSPVGSLPAACLLFSRGVIFTHAPVSLALLSLRKNGGLLVVYFERLPRILSYSLPLTQTFFWLVTQSATPARKRHSWRSPKKWPTIHLTFNWGGYDRMGDFRKSMSCRLSSKEKILATRDTRKAHGLAPKFPFPSHACYAIACLPRRHFFGSSRNQPPKRGKGTHDEALKSDRPFDFQLRGVRPYGWFQKKNVLRTDFEGKKFLHWKKNL